MGVGTIGGFSTTIEACKVVLGMNVPMRLVFKQCDKH